MLGYDETAVTLGLLTLEHVPPKALGGRGIALTCRTCNNVAGHTVDAAVSRREELWKFRDLVLEGTGESPVYAALEINGVPVNVKVALEADGTRVIHLLAVNNDPELVARVSEHLERGSVQGVLEAKEFTLTSRAEYHVRRAMVGDLRTAYLTTFATFGYRYAFDLRLDAVREQILSPDLPILAGWDLHLGSAAKNARAIVITNDRSAVMVQLGTVGVLLPWISAPVDFYKRVCAMYIPDERLKLKGRLVPWPSRLEMALDFGVR
jgi:hypothetical protein